MNPVSRRRSPPFVRRPQRLGIAGYFIVGLALAVLGFVLLIVAGEMTYTTGLTQDEERSVITFYLIGSWVVWFLSGCCIFIALVAKGVQVGNRSNLY